LGLKGILLTWEATKLSNITKPCNNMHYKRVSTLENYCLSRYTVGIQDGFDSLSTRLFIDVIMSFARREFDSPHIHKSKTVYVDGVASRYTNSRTYGVAWF
jgi:hypothetical protein